LEYDKILLMVAGCALTSRGTDIVSRMEPSTDFTTINARLSETDEAVRVINSGNDAPFGGITDIRESLLLASKGAGLTPQDLLDISTTAGACRRLGRFLSRLTEGFPLLSAQATAFSEYPKFEAAVDNAISPRGDILDSASPELNRARHRIHALHESIQRELSRVLGSDLLQDPIITQRGGRFCVPVKIEARNSFKGIVHDISSSGQTAFMEPFAVVELGNDLREAEGKEKEEEQKVLAALTALAGECAPGMLRNIDVAARLDAIFARGRFAVKYNCIMPGIADEIYLRQARHPLLGANAVPIDVTLGEDNRRVMLITGPNTGGKTVTLKTVGLMAMMTQSGLHIPAEEGSRLPIFTGVFADIGDEQSIEQNLSTFSGHMTAIIRILKDAKKGGLVLFDELGAGTDPTEGAALAKVILADLYERGCTIIATTHYGELKVYAQSAPGFLNASVEFDLLTLRPTYKLISGLPGSSNALAIAGRLGLPKDIITKAKETAGTSALEIEEVLKQAEGARRALDRERTAATIKRKEAEKLAEKYKKELEELDSKRTSAIGKVRTQARETLDKARSEVNNLLEELRVAIKENRDAKYGAQPELRKKSREVLRELDEMISQLPGEDENKSAATDLPRLTSVKAGQNVMVVSLGHKGVALQDGVGKEEITVQVGIMKVKAPVSDLVLSAPKNNAPLPKPEKALAIENELNLVGLRAEDAESQLTEYLAMAYDSRLREVRIVHGFGAGILRKMVRDILNHSPLVKSIRTGESNEGGGGVTMVMLK